MLNNHTETALNFPGRSIFNSLSKMLYKEKRAKDISLSPFTAVYFPVICNLYLFKHDQFISP